MLSWSNTVYFTLGLGHLPYWSVPWFGYHCSLDPSNVDNWNPVAQDMNTNPKTKPMILALFHYQLLRIIALNQENKLKRQKYTKKIQRNG